MKVGLASGSSLSSATGISLVTVTSKVSHPDYLFSPRSFLATIMNSTGSFGLTSGRRPGP
jgi:hypothetical protein